MRRLSFRSAFSLPFFGATFHRSRFEIRDSRFETRYFKEIYDSYLLWERERRNASFFSFRLEQGRSSTRREIFVGSENGGKIWIESARELFSFFSFFFFNGGKGWKGGGILNGCLTWVLTNRLERLIGREKDGRENEERSDMFGKIQDFFRIDKSRKIEP